MFRKISGSILAAASFFLCLSAAHAHSRAIPKPDPDLHIDIPTKLDKANVVVDMGHLVFNGDARFALGDINLIATNFQEWSTIGQIVVIFHGDPAYLVLNDDSYNENRHASAGNRYKDALNGLMLKGRAA